MLRITCCVLFAGSSGVVRFSDVSSGAHRLRIVATTSEGERVVERRKIVVCMYVHTVVDPGGKGGLLFGPKRTPGYPREINDFMQ